jgi:hypothetical protein
LRGAASQDEMYAQMIQAYMRIVRVVLC